jgi:hypothetical protein
MLFFDLSTRKASDEKEERERKMQELKCFENIVKNGTFAPNVQMPHFPQCFQRSSATMA